MKRTAAGIGAVLFDLDDTLVAFDAVTDSSWKQVCREFCLENSRLEPEQLFMAIKEYSKWYWSDEERHRLGRNDLVTARRYIVSTVFKKLALSEAKAVMLADRYSQVRVDNMYLLEGAEELLIALMERGVQLALLTNGDSQQQRRKLKRFCLEKYFNSILIEGETGIGKPDARIYRMALAGLDVKPEQAVMVGDNLQWDVEAPQQCGIFSIWHDWCGLGLPRNSRVRPDAVIRKPLELMSVPGFFD